MVSLVRLLMFSVLCVVGAFAACVNPSWPGIQYCTGLPSGLYQTVGFDRVTHQPVSTSDVATEVFLDGTYRNIFTFQQTVESGAIKCSPASTETVVHYHVIPYNMALTLVKRSE
jgi:hypothetical protein